MASIFEKEWISDYKYHDEINFRPDNTNNKTLSKIQVIDAYDNGDITMSDLYIVYVVHVMTFANTYQIIEYLKWWNKYNKQIPINPGEDSESFDNRVKALTKNSILRRYKFKNAEGKQRDYYYVTAHGYNFLRRKLYYNGSYDEYLGAAPLQEVLKYLANNEILIRILQKAHVEAGYHLESKPLYASHVQFFDKATRSNVTTYGFMNIRKEDSKLKFLFEPYRPTYDANNYASGQMQELYTQRMEFIKRYIDEYIRANAGTAGLHVLFVAESIQALKEVAAVVVKFNDYYRNCIYFTCDKLIAEHGIRNSIIQLKPKDDKYTLGTVQLEL